MRHARGVYDVVRLAHDVPLDEHDPGCIPPDALRGQLARFPEGQFVAVTEVAGRERVIGAATLMRTNRPPTAKPLGWLEMVGSPSLANHEPDGRWLYGVEMSVHPDYQGRGVGSALYRARLGLIRRFGLAGMYAGGMLKGYQHYAHEMSPREYGERVMRGDLHDPTVSMQIGKGFEAHGVIEDYEDDAQAGNCAVLIAWTPDDLPPGRGFDGALPAPVDR